MPQSFLFPTFKDLGTLPGIAAGAKINVTIPPNGKKYGWALHCTGAGGDLTVAQIKNDIGKIIIRVNGQPLWEATATELLMLQQAMGAAIVNNNVAGVLPILITPQDLPLWSDRKTFGWGMQGINAVTMEINLTSGLATLTGLELWEYSSDEVQSMGTHMQFREFPRAFSSTGDDNISDLVNNQDDLAYKGFFIQIPGTSTITKVSVKLNNQLVYDQVAPVINQVFGQYGQHQLQTGWYFVDFSMIRDLSGMLPMKGVTDFRTTITWATAAPTSYVIKALLYKGLILK